jgi:hypothetical protein
MSGTGLLLSQAAASAQLQLGDYSRRPRDAKYIAGEIAAFQVSG